MNPPTSAVRLMIVDDESAQLKALCDSLGEHGYEPRGFTSPTAALAALQTQPCDLLLTNLVLPGTDGIALVRAAFGNDSDLAAVLMTGEGTVATAVQAVQAMQSGALDYIVKPVRISTLLPVIERALSVRRLRQQKLALERAVREHASELQQANKELEAFAQSVAHDMRNSLNAIVGLSSLLAAPSPSLSESQARQFAAHIRDSGIRMGALFDDLLRLSRIRHCELRRAKVDLTAMARESFDKLRAGTPGRQVRVEIEPGVFADGDIGLLQIALDNLLANAWKYTGTRTDARIEFGTGAAGPGRVYVVRDNGAGFDMAQAQHLFEPFHRLHRDADFPGTGIGLSIVHRVIQRHGGRIWADAAAGQGACFQFTLGPD